MLRFVGEMGSFCDQERNFRMIPRKQERAVVGITDRAFGLHRVRPAYRLPLLVAAGFFLIYIAFLAPGIYSLDGNSMLAVSESLVTHHSFTVPAGLGIPGVGGRIYSTWYLLLSVITVPSTYVAIHVSRLTGLPFHYLAAVFALPLSGALTAATSAMVALLTLRMGGSRKGAWLAAVSFGLGTIALVYARLFFAEPLLAFLTVSALYFTLGRSPSDIALAACFAGLAMLSKPTGVVVGPVLAAYLLAKRVPFPRSILPLVGTAVGFAIYSRYNILRFGQPFNFGLSWPFRLRFLLPGLAGLLASPGWGLLWYCPALVLAIFGFRKAIKDRMIEALAIVAMFAAFVSLHALAWYWWGGWSWGPRFLLPAIPGLCSLLGLLEGNLRKAVIVLTILGFIVNAPTSFSFFEDYCVELAERGISADDTIAWSFRYAPFCNAWPAALRQVRNARQSDVREIFAQRGAPSHTSENSRALRIVAIWWWVLPVAHVSRWAGFLLSLFIAALGSLLLGRALRLSWQNGSVDDTVPSG